MLEGAIIGLLMWLIQNSGYRGKTVGTLTETQRTNVLNSVMQHNNNPKNSFKQTTMEKQLLSIQKQIKIGRVVLVCLVALWIAVLIFLYPRLLENV